MPAPDLTIDLNCDLGEGFPHDATLIPLVTSVNIACGGHAGDDATMRAAVRLAHACGANIGAHPGYEDRAQFGRVELPLSPAAVRESIERQCRRLQHIANDEGAMLRHVKPHGALYHVAGRDADIAQAVVDAVIAGDRTLAILVPPASQLTVAAERAGLKTVLEGFADRRYQMDGTLVPRSAPDAVIEDESAAAFQAIELIRNGKVATANGAAFHFRPATLCVHGDGGRAVELLTALRKRFAEAAIDVKPFGR